MRIKFERSGGFAGMVVSKEIDVSELGPDEAKKITGLVHNSEFFKLPKKAPAAAMSKRSVQPDRFQYKLTIEDDDKRHTVTASEQNLPANLKPLVDWLNVEARKPVKVAKADKADDK